MISRLIRLGIVGPEDKVRSRIYFGEVSHTGLEISNLFIIKSSTRVEAVGQAITTSAQGEREP